MLCHSDKCLIFCIHCVSLELIEGYLNCFAEMLIIMQDVQMQVSDCWGQGKCHYDLIWDVSCLLCITWTDWRKLQITSRNVNNTEMCRAWVRLVSLKIKVIFCLICKIFCRTLMFCPWLSVCVAVCSLAISVWQNCLKTDWRYPLLK